MNTPHQPRLDRALHSLLQTHRVAALGTLDVDGQPFVSMVPFAVDRDSAQLIIHVSLLAPHTRNLLSQPTVSMMVMQAETPAEPVHALPRVSMTGAAQRLPVQSPAWQSARAIYLARFPEAEPITELGDFSFFAIKVTAARHVAGFGNARPLDGTEMATILKWSESE